MVAGPNPAEGSNFAPDSLKRLGLRLYRCCRMLQRCCSFLQRLVPHASFWPWLSGGNAMIADN
ncbi:MAG TPA: hypothetical protein VLU95_01785 [Candidatus Acidoferrum sp.]|nr:hypothetical protein [Candidatus Acidoferrum sp.]